MKDLNKRITLLCPICGNDQFESLDGDFDDAESTPDDAKFRCSDCNSVFTKEVLINENAEKINNTVEELKQDIIKEVEHELKKMLRDFKL